ncbi:MAG: UMP kinase [Planctomycetota bacterium]
MDDRPNEHQPSRALLKLSGESMSGEGRTGIDADCLTQTARELSAARERCPAGLAVVTGGGNILRGATLASQGVVDRASADHMGMLGTIMNAVALRDRLDRLGVPSAVLSAVGVRGIAEEYTRRRGLELLDEGRILILAAGVGSPFFTTDSGAALRAAELKCGRLLKATKVDGVYSADPKKDPAAQRFDTITFKDAIERRLKVMDLGAIAMCEEHGVELVVFDFLTEGNIAKVVGGDPIGTRVVPG